MQNENPASSPAVSAVSESPQGRFFATADLDQNLGRRSVRGAAVTLSAQLTKFALRFGSTALLARLLTPEDYGLIAMTAVVTGFAGLFKDAGLTSATIQRADLRHEQASTLLWINVALGCGIAVALAAVAPLVAAFFREPRLSSVTAVLALTFVLSGFTVQHQAILRRQMRFGALALIEIVSMSAGIVTALVMAYAGVRYWALVGLALGTALANLVAVWGALAWRPGRPRRDAGVTQMLKFGGDVLSFNVVNFFSRHADNLLLGWYWGAVSLGLYEKAYSLLLLPIMQINAPMAAVAVPTLSRTCHDPARFRRFFLATLRIIASVSVPIVLLIALFADEIVALWLGPQWHESAKLFRLLSVAALLSALSNPMGWMLVSAGQTRRYRQLGLATAPLVIASFAVALPFGAEGVALAYSAVMAVLFVPAWAWAVRGTALSLRDIGLVLSGPLAAAAFATVGAIGSMRMIGETMADPFRVGMGAAVFAAIYAVVLLVVFRQWTFFTNIARQGLSVSEPHGVTSEVLLSPE